MKGTEWKPSVTATELKRLLLIEAMARRLVDQDMCLSGYCGTDAGKECTCGVGDLRDAVRGTFIPTHEIKGEMYVKLEDMLKHLRQR